MEVTTALAEALGKRLILRGPECHTREVVDDLDAAGLKKQRDDQQKK